MHWLKGTACLVGLVFILVVQIFYIRSYGRQEEKLRSTQEELAQARKEAQSCDGRYTESQKKPTVHDYVEAEIPPRSGNWFPIDPVGVPLPGHYRRRWVSLSGGGYKDLDGTMQKYTGDSTVETVLTESLPVAKPLRLFGGLLIVEPGYAASGPVPVWIVPGKVKPQIYDETAIGKPNLVYYWLNMKDRKIDGPYLPNLSPGSYVPQEDSR